MADLGLGGVNVGPKKVQRISLLVQEQMNFSGGVQGAGLQRVAMLGNVHRGSFHALRETSHQLIERAVVIFDGERLSGGSAGRYLEFRRWKGCRGGDCPEWGQGFPERQTAHT